MRDKRLKAVLCFIGAAICVYFGTTELVLMCSTAIHFGMRALHCTATWFCFCMALVLALQAEDVMED